MNNKSSDKISKIFEHPLQGNDLQTFVSIYIAEYNALRREIDTYHRHKKEIMNFTFIVLGAMLSIVSAIILSEDANKTSSIAFIFLLFPFFYLLLSLLYTDRTIRIITVADYINNYLRKEVSKVLGHIVWQWEAYKTWGTSDVKTPIFNTNLRLILDRIRWFFFIIPSLLSLGLFFYYLPASIEIFHIIFIIFDIFIILIGILVMFVTEETTGVKDREIKLPTSLEIFETSTP